MPNLVMRFGESPSGPSNATGALIIASIALVIIIFFRQVGRDVRAAQKRLARATPAQAEVIEVENSGPSNNAGTVEVRLQLEVTPPGRPPYRVTVPWYVDLVAIPKVQEGSRFRVKVDPEDPEIVYPGESWAEYAGYISAKRTRK